MNLNVPAWSRTRPDSGSGADGQVAVHAWGASPGNHWQILACFMSLPQLSLEVFGAERPSHRTLRNLRVGSGSPPDACFSQPPPSGRGTCGREPAPQNPSAWALKTIFGASRYHFRRLAVVEGLLTRSNREVCEPIRPGPLCQPHLVETPIPRGSCVRFELNVIELELIMRPAVSRVRRLGFVLVVLLASLPPAICGRQRTVRMGKHCAVSLNASVHRSQQLLLLHHQCSHRSPG